MTRTFPLAIIALLVMVGFAQAQPAGARFDQVDATATFPNGEGALFGLQTLALGDLNGNGTIDFAVSDFGYTGDRNVPSLLGLGAVHLFDGAGVPAAYLGSLYGSTNQELGIALARVSDFNNDGIAEFAVGSSGGAGRIDIVDPTTLGIQATFFGVAGSASFGRAIESIADVTGDGIADLLVFETGFINVVNGVSGANLGRSAIATSPNPWGRDLAVYDANGDGYDDFAIGDFSVDTVYLYDGRPASVGSLLTSIVGTSGSGFGSDVCHLGAGGGTHMVAIGAYTAASVEIWKLDLIQPSVNQVSVVTAAAGSYFGFSVAPVAVPGGGIDFITAEIGAPSYDFHKVSAAGAIDFSFTPAFRGQPAITYVENAGDVSGNGWDDYIVGGTLGTDASVLLYVGGPKASVANRGFGAMAPPLVMVPKLSWSGLPTVGNSAFTLIQSFSQVGSAGQVVTGTPNPGFLVLAPNFFSWLNPLYSQNITAGFVAPVAYPIPANPWLIGMTFTAQAYALGPVGFEFTNAVDYTIGY